MLRYRTFNGEEMESAFSQMLQHVVNHATYHRGQVTTMLRQLGAPAPKSQDLIRFYRERASRVHYNQAPVLVAIYFVPNAKTLRRKDSFERNS